MTNEGEMMLSLDEAEKLLDVYGEKDFTLEELDICCMVSEKYSKQFKRACIEKEPYSIWFVDAAHNGFLLGIAEGIKRERARHKAREEKKE